MEFGNVKSIDTLINEIRGYNRPYLEAFNLAICFLKIPAAVPKLTKDMDLGSFFKVIHEFWDELRAEKPARILGKLQHFGSFINKGHEMSRLTRDKKVEALPHFRKADSLAEDLLSKLRKQGRPIWPFILLA